MTPPRPKRNRAAKRLTSFPLPSESRITSERSVTVLDDGIAFNFAYLLAPHAPIFHLIVIYWTKPDERSTSYPRRYVAGPTAKDAKKQGILETNAFPHRDCADGKRMWQGCAGLFADQASAPFLCTTSTRIAIQCHREIMGIIMKHDQTEGIEVVQLTSLPSPNLLDQSHLRYHHAISYPDRTDAPPVALSFVGQTRNGMTYPSHSPPSTKSYLSRHCTEQHFAESITFGYFLRVKTPVPSVVTGSPLMIILYAKTSRMLTRHDSQLFVTVDVPLKRLSKSVACLR
ncbi:hypothetical protein D9619_009644 [Psilocybe cf. subviscida]|uniref:Uncharacterized protein n=1 Tax=Psilocybe cf. subviscida TaxID=2480587 RepID=A0A8H5BLL9_9AGAR|nr:hypothetical protein D9619_009644 [Psilocybe cf. subviscida]